MALVFMAVLLARFIELITWSWVVVIPGALGASVVTAALISTILFSQGR